MKVLPFGLLPHTLTSRELDTALAARRVRLIPSVSHRTVRCLLQHCRVLVPPTTGAVVLIDEHVRGRMCAAHWKETILACTNGKEIEDDQHHDESQRLWVGVHKPREGA